MAYLHTPLSGGYTTTGGEKKQAIMVVSETTEELTTGYDYLVSLQLVIDELQSINTLKGWNNHDEEVIPGVAQNIGPLHRGGRFKNITESQLIKLLRAIQKVDSALRGRLNTVMGAIPDYFSPKNADQKEPQLNKQLVKRLNDIRRDGIAEQEELLQNPDLINDNSKPFKETWHWYWKKKKNKQ
tara:strand:- start:3411 stop:3962 length:552 start_codon:yes stop_codon:yes gene_type:complete